MKRVPLLYYRTIKQIKKYQAIPVRKRLRWLEEGARFFARVRLTLPGRYQRSRKTRSVVGVKNGI